ncbi:hypothetical protein SAMN05444695_103349 [Rhodococcus triatomae]|uniref:Uncharacterized protein n=1 Tax=Rhodococcus triatomae TaxID=300028 RepID=A0A1G8FQ09_9NOCA|nr:hypothetical protein SAMN05444695_103349 [Rhodococcus triatomae]
MSHTAVRVIGLTTELDAGGLPLRVSAGFGPDFPRTCGCTCVYEYAGFAETYVTAPALRPAKVVIVGNRARALRDRPEQNVRKS